ncbi:MAG: MarR family transcriptional regulator [Bacteroidales bacterium]|nr:MarR family transcriptional regulator [Bacteroidales bacterium]
MDNKEKVIKALSDSSEPLKAGELSDLTGLEKKEIDKIIKVLKTENTIQSPKKCYYSLNKL